MSVGGCFGGGCEGALEISIFYLEQPLLVVLFSVDLWLGCFQCAFIRPNKWGIAIKNSYLDHYKLAALEQFFVVDEQDDYNNFDEMMIVKIDMITLITMNEQDESIDSKW